MKTLQEFLRFLTEESMIHDSLVDEFIVQLQEFDELEEVENFLNHKLGESVVGGVGRRIWNLNATKIIKVAKFAGASDQNKKEVKHANCLGEKFAPVIYDFDRKNYFWILEERLTPISGEKLFDKLQTLMGYRFKDWIHLKQFFADSIHYTDLYGKDPVFHKSYETSQWFKKLVDELRGCRVGSEDFHDENWGIRPSTGEVVLLDLGF